MQGLAKDIRGEIHDRQMPPSGERANTQYAPPDTFVRLTKLIWACQPPQEVAVLRKRRSRVVADG